MAQSIELRADLTDLGGKKFIVVNQLVGTERTAGRAAGNAQAEGTGAEQRHAGFINAANPVDLAVLDRLHRVQRFRRGHVVGRARFIVRAPFRGPPFLRGRRRGRLRLRGHDGGRAELPVRGARDGANRPQAGGLQEAAAILARA